VERAVSSTRRARSACGVRARGPRELRALAFACLAAASPLVAADWTWENATPTGAALNAVWGIDADTSIAVGELGTVLRSENGCWEPLPTGSWAALTDVWGASLDELFVAGDLYYEPPQGYGILHLKDGIWAKEPTPSSVTQLRHAALWGTSATDVYAAGANESFLHYDGKDWSKIAVNPQDLPCGRGYPVDFKGLCGVSPDEIYLFWNCTSSSGSSHYFRWNGSTLEDLGPSPDAGITADLWCSGTDDIWAPNWNSLVGQQTVRHFDGTGWTAEPSPVPTWAIDGLPGAEPWAVGGGLLGEHPAVFQRSSGSWGAMSTSLARYRELLDLAVFGTDSAVAVGDFGAIARWDGDSWNWISRSAADVDLRSIHQISDNQLVAAGNGGKVFLGTDRSWAELPPTGTTDDFRGVWGTSPANLFAVGWGPGPSGFAFRFNGTSWSLMTVPANTKGLFAVWGSDAANVYAAGYTTTTGTQLRVLELAGGQWIDQTVPVLSEVGAALYGFGPNDVFLIACGPSTYRASMLHFDGEEWTTIASANAGTPPCEVNGPNGTDALWGTSGTDLWYAGSGSNKLWHWDGEAWSVKRTTPCDLSAVRGDGGRIVTAGYCGVVSELDDGIWSEKDAHGYRVRAIAGNEASGLVAVGDRGMILRSEPRLVFRESFETGRICRWRHVAGGL
jgi:photosystem II stability/assembly factor-like uncharacterized protein